MSSKTKPDPEVDALRALIGLQGRNEEGARDYIDVLERKIQRQRNWAYYLESRNGPELRRIQKLERDLKIAQEALVIERHEHAKKNWIPIADREPTKSGYYHAHPNPYQDGRGLWWNNLDKVFQDPSEDGIAVKVTHWKPITQPEG